MYNLLSRNFPKFNYRTYSQEVLKKVNINKINEEKSPALTDLHGRHHTYLRISLTERCNLRCQYCMPLEGVQLSPSHKLLTTDEIFHISKLFVAEGVKKIRLTGGEPTVRKDLLKIIENLKQLDDLETIGLTTNGLTLTRQLVGLQRAGLDLLNISLDTLKSDRYEQITRRKGWERVMMGIDLALQLGYNPVKINCVIIKGFNDDEILDFVRMTKDKNVDVRFIEYMPFSGNRWEMDKMLSYQKMVNLIKTEWPDFHALPNQPNDTSKAWKVPNYSGRIGFITSMSEHFCGSCNRLRITADGNLKVCLFGNTEISLRDAIRNGCSDDDLSTMIGLAVKRKRKQHADSGKQYIHHPIKPTTTNLSHLFPQTHTMNSLRLYSTTSQPLTHLDKDGNPVMVDVTPKPITVRVATAQATIKIGSRLIEMIKSKRMKKGDVLNIAQVAGILGAKKTSEIIPLCHNIPLTNIQVSAEIQSENESIIISATVQSTGKTGVEMEALSAVSIAALTIYDMCKSVNRAMVITDVQLLKKTGGTSDRESITLDFDTSPIDHENAVVVGHL